MSCVVLSQTKVKLKSESGRKRGGVVEHRDSLRVHVAGFWN